METGFLNPIHDEEHFSSYYNQGNVLEDSEHMLFGEMIVPEIVDYDNLWPPSDDLDITSQGENKSSQKEEFQKMLSEWQHQLNYMQEPEAIKRIVPLGSSLDSQEGSEMFPSSVPATSTPAPCIDPSIDELFPLETNNRDLSSTDFFRSSGDKTSSLQDETWTTNEAKTHPEESPQQIKSNSSTILDQSNAIGVMTAAPEIKLEPKTEISIKKEIEEDQEKEVDVETVEGDEIPLLMAGDLTSLLEQFEATEKVNAIQTPPSPSRLSNQTIRDALPAEVINRIKATRESHKKIISVIPAMPNKRPGRAATRMQDAGATLSRNKLLKLVTGGSGGESVQLDHDYCTNGGDSTSSSSRSYYMSDSSEYPSQSSTPDTSRMPDFKIKESIKACDSGSRKDSGLESGENSDEEIPSVNRGRSKIVLKSSTGLKSVHLVNESGVVIGSGAAMVQKNIPMISVLKKNIKVENEPKKLNSSSMEVVVKECPSQVVQCDVGCTQNEMDSPEVSRKKKKLNLEEYRVRREEREKFRSQESSRASSPVPCLTPPVQPDSTTSVGSHESIPKEKPLMLTVEVQTQTCDFIDLTSAKSSKEHDNSRSDIKGKRNDLKHSSYQSRHASASSSSSSADRHRSYRRKRSSRKRSRSRRRNSVSRMWSRSPSSSSSGSQSEESSQSRSRSRSRDRRQRWRNRSPRRSSRYDSSRSCRSGRDRSWQRNRSPMRGIPTRMQDFPSQEKVRQVEERRVIYVGRIDEGTTKADLRKRFQQFGPIVDISVHFRERGDNYGFVTFAYKADAYKAVEHGNDDPKLPRYDLCFGGRRAFCKQRYADLDGLATNVHCQYGPPPAMQSRSNESFDLLLNEVKAQLRKRSTV